MRPLSLFPRQARFFGLLLAGLFFAPACLSGAGSFQPVGELIRGDGYAYFLSPPLGWVLDRSLASASESDAVLYPKGSTFKSAASVIYASVYSKDGDYKNLGDFLDQDLLDARRQNPGLKMEKGGFLPTFFQKNAVLRFYSGLEDGSVEAVAYIEEKEMIVILSLSTSNPQILNEDLPALQELVGSYQLMELAQ